MGFNILMSYKDKIFDNKKDAPYPIRHKILNMSDINTMPDIMVCGQKKSIDGFCISDLAGRNACFFLR